MMPKGGCYHAIAMLCVDRDDVSVVVEELKKFVGKGGKFRKCKKGVAKFACFKMCEFKLELEFKFEVVVKKMVEL